MILKKNMRVNVISSSRADESKFIITIQEVEYKWKYFNFYNTLIYK
jgi:hypothetical protein